jgi:serine/threonine protein kinase
MHRNGVTHRDIKFKVHRVHRDLTFAKFFQNVVIDEHYDVKLIDFGSASEIPKDPKDYFTHFNGTEYCASPEVLKGARYRGPEADMWYLF